MSVPIRKISSNPTSDQLYSLNSVSSTLSSRSTPFDILRQQSFAFSESRNSLVELPTARSEGIVDVGERRPSTLSAGTDDNSLPGGMHHSSNALVVRRISEGGGEEIVTIKGTRMPDDHDRQEQYGRLSGSANMKVINNDPSASTKKSPALARPSATEKPCPVRPAKNPARSEFVSAAKSPRQKTPILDTGKTISLPPSETTLSPTSIKSPDSGAELSSELFGVWKGFTTRATTIHVSP